MDMFDMSFFELQQLWWTSKEGEDFPIFISIYKIKQYFTISISNVVLCLAFHQSMKTQMQWRISIYFNAEVTNRTDENVTMKK